MELRLPHNFDVEKMVLGAMMDNVRVIPDVLDLVGQEMFYRKRHWQFFQAIQKLYVDDRPVDQVTLFEEMQEKEVSPGEIASEIASLVSYAPARPHDAIGHAQRLRQLWAQRELIVVRLSPLKA